MTFPNMNEAFWDWTTATQFQVVQKSVADYEASETPVITTTFDGVLEPIHPRALLVKPEGQRTWNWWSLWTKKSLQPGDIVVDQDNKEYRVMSINNWSNADYQQYELVQNPPLGS